MLTTSTNVGYPKENVSNILSESDRPVFLMNVPLSLNFNQPNNATMEGLSEAERNLDLKTALDQFHELYAFASKHSIVYLLPSAEGFQDQTYVSNVAAHLPHLDEATIVLSNFRSEPRIGEELIARPFLSSLGYKVCKAPRYFEGEADLKHLRGNIYLGAHGMRTSKDALHWMEEHFKMTILPVRIHDPHAYHLDCVAFPLDKENTLLCTKLIDTPELIAIAKHTNIIDVSYDAAMAMATNCLRIKNQLLVQTNISLYQQGDEMYEWEKEKTKFLEKICSAHGLKLNLFDLSEFRKSGAALSCFFLKLK